MNEYLTLSIAIVITLSLILLSYRAYKKNRWGSFTVGLLLCTPAIISTVLISSAILDKTTIERLTKEHAIATITFENLGRHHYQASFQEPHRNPVNFDIYGDQWQIDARIMKWNGFAGKMGLKPIYQFERLSGRYEDVQQEMNAKRSVYALTEKKPLESIWDYLVEYQDYIPWLEKQYGSATYMPMKHGAIYTINLSQNGLVARPRNAIASQSVKQWL